jgi:hypothetical protein
MADSRRHDIKEFFTLTKEKPWGRLLAVDCKPSDLMEYRDNNIPDTLQRVIRTEDWQFNDSRSWAKENSGHDIFYMFKVHALWKSIRFNGVKSPIHVHAKAGEDWLEFHPSRNKIEVLTEYFPELPVTALYHEYNLLAESYPEPCLTWYKDLPHKEISTTTDYYNLYKLDESDPQLLLQFGWDWCRDIIKDPEGVWGKVKPKARDWRNIKPQEHLSDSNYENALFLTVTDRYHRVAMDKVNILLKDIIQTKPGQVKFCGKWYEVE